MKKMNLKSVVAAAITLGTLAGSQAMAQSKALTTDANLLGKLMNLQAKAEVVAEPSINLMGLSALGYKVTNLNSNSADKTQKCQIFVELQKGSKVQIVSFSIATPESFEAAGSVKNGLEYGNKYSAQYQEVAADCQNLK